MKICIFSKFFILWVKEGFCRGWKCQNCQKMKKELDKNSKKSLWRILQCCRSPRDLSSSCHLLLFFFLLNFKAEMSRTQKKSLFQMPVLAEKGDWHQTKFCFCYQFHLQLQQSSPAVLWWAGPASPPTLVNVALSWQSWVFIV